MDSRIIRLRRPPTLHVQDQPFVPAVANLDEIESRWRALRKANPAYYDGRLLHVLGVHRNGHGGAVLHLADCAYRFHAVQNESFDLGVRSLGVKGLIILEGRVLLGKRSRHVGHNPGLWEFAPGGGVDPNEAPSQTIIKELEEETGFAPTSDPVAIALIYDDSARSWELIYRIESGEQQHKPSAEYDELRWCAPTDLPSDLSPISRLMTRLLTESKQVE